VDLSETQPLGEISQKMFGLFAATQHRYAANSMTNKTRTNKHPTPTRNQLSLSATDYTRIGRAIDAAHKSRMKVRVGALVASGGKHTSVACNRERNDPRLGHLDASVHAEIAALRKLSSKPKGGTIYVARLGSTGALLPSFPCHRCLPAIGAMGIKRVVWWDGRRWVGSLMRWT